jgi:hypothetical protein
MKLLCCLLIAPLLTAQELPPADKLLQLSLERSGGEAAFARLKNAVMTGTIEINGHNISGTVAVYQADGKSYTAIELPGIGKVEEGFDGTTAWESNALQGPRIKSGDEREAVAHASRISMLSGWRDEYASAKTVGTEDVNGKPAWKVVMTPKSGKPETFYFDKASGLLVRTAETMVTPLGEISVEADMSDYRPVDGVETPFTTTQKAISQVMVMHFDKVAYNTDIAPDRFDLPAPIKALRDRDKNPPPVKTPPPGL